MRYLKPSSAFLKDIKTFLEISWLLLLFFFKVFANYERLCSSTRR